VAIAWPTPAAADDEVSLYLGFACPATCYEWLVQSNLAEVVAKNIHFQLALMLAANSG